MALRLADIPAFCINLDSRPDRWAAVQLEFARLEWPIERFSASQGSAAPGKLSRAHAGCLDSHKRLWRLCLERAYPVLAVFEDDAVFPGDFKDIFARASAELPSDWALWHLHSFHAKTRAVSKYLVRYQSRGWGTHGYVIRPRACELLLSLPDDAPVDARMTEGITRVHGQVFGTALRYALCFQRGDDSDIPDTSQLEFWRKQRDKYSR